MQEPSASTSTWETGKTITSSMAKIGGHVDWSAFVQIRLSRFLDKTLQVQMLPPMLFRISDIRISGKLQIRIPRNSDSRYSGFPEIRQCGNAGIPEIQISGALQIRSSGNPEFQNPDFRKSGFPDSRISGFSDSRVS